MQVFEENDQARQGKCDVVGVFGQRALVWHSACYLVLIILSNTSVLWLQAHFNSTMGLVMGL